VLENHTLNLPGGRRGIVHRTGRGPLIVWLHGPHGVRPNDPFIAKLSERYSVFAPLSPGFSDLDELDDIDTVHDLALYYDDVFETLGPEPLTLIGHSFGAMIAAEYAAHFTRRVRKLVLASPIGLWRDDHPLPDMFGLPFQRMDTLLWKDGGASQEWLNPADDQRDEVEKQVATVQAMTTFAKFIWPIPDRRLRRRLPRISAETLLIGGADDLFLPSIYLNDFTAAIARARSVTVENAAHMVPYESPDEVRQVIDGHIMPD
jgi:pimeloyl-ACP methyl ester carboxylesterase